MSIKTADLRLERKGKKKGGGVGNVGGKGILIQPYSKCRGGGKRRGKTGREWSSESGKKKEILRHEDFRKT